MQLYSSVLLLTKEGNNDYIDIHRLHISLVLVILDSGGTLNLMMCGCGFCRRSMECSIIECKVRQVMTSWIKWKRCAIPWCGASVFWQKQVKSSEIQDG